MNIRFSPALKKNPCRFNINILLSNSFTKSVKIKIKKKIYLFVFMLSDLKGVSVFVEN